MFNAGLQFRFSHEAEIWTWRAPSSMLQYTDIQFLEGLVSHFGRVHLGTTRFTIRNRK
jgi:hypothetical protein